MKSFFDYSIAKINYLTPSHLQLILFPTKSIMPFEAGQYLTVLYPNGENMPLSIANAPTLTHEIELHLRVSEEDFATQEFVRSLSLGNTLRLNGPFGKCQYKDQAKSILLLSAGTGFAPAKAIVENLIAQNVTKECYLYWTVKQLEDFYLSELPIKWQHLPNFHFVGIATQAEKSQRKKNILDIVIKDFANFLNVQVYVFGPPSLAIQALKLLIPLGLNKNNFFTDVLSEQEINKIFSVVIPT